MWGRAGKRVSRNAAGPQYLGRQHPSPAELTLSIKRGAASDHEWEKGSVSEAAIWNASHKKEVRCHQEAAWHRKGRVRVNRARAKQNSAEDLWMKKA